MRILYLVHRIPFPPNKGDKIRSFHEIKHFSRRHEIHLLAFCDQPDDARYSQELEVYCRSVTLVSLRPWPQRGRAVAWMLRGRPWTLGYFASPIMAKALARELREHSFDLVFAFSSSMAPYARSVNNVPKILDFVDSDASKWQQYADLRPAPSKWLYSCEARSLKRFEADMVRDFDFSVFVSKREAEHLHEATNGEKVHFIQNGVDLEHFAAVSRSGSSKGIVFTGAMDYYPNIDAVTFFAHEILPAVRSAVPDARFLIVGSNPSPHVRLLANLPGVTVTGTVKDVRPFLADAGVAVVPARISQGIQNKILESLASGLPVVATKAALAGMSYTKDLPVAEADNAGSFAERVAEFLKNPLSCAQVEACRRSLRLAYDWDVNLSAFDRLFERLAPAHRSV